MTAPLARLSASLADRYTIERELGRGGMATVYLAHDLRHDRKVAVKVLRPELAATLGSDRFLSEIRTTAKLNHPLILALHDSGNADGFLFYVMPLVEGESLRERMTREKTLPVEEAVRLTREVAKEVARHGVRVNYVSPSTILTERTQTMIPAERRAQLTAMHPLGDSVRPRMSPTPSFSWPPRAPPGSPASPSTSPAARS